MEAGNWERNSCLLEEQETLRAQPLSHLSSLSLSLSSPSLPFSLSPSPLPSLLPSLPLKTKSQYVPPTHYVKAAFELTAVTFASAFVVLMSQACAPHLDGSTSCLDPVPLPTVLGCNEPSLFQAPSTTLLGHLLTDAVDFLLVIKKLFSSFICSLV